MGLIEIKTVPPASFENYIDELADILAECVRDGASVNFILPFDRDDALHFWRKKVETQHRIGDRILIIALENESLVGTVQLDIGMPPNQSHRSEVTKLLVRPSCRRKGVARRLMRCAEEHAISLRRSLITLDTRTGDAAEKLYSSIGFKEAGSIPNYSRAPDSDRLDSSTYMYKIL